MPACFQLTRKSDAELAYLQDVDVEMCKHFKVEPSEVAWYKNWYNTIGLALAMGHNWERIKTEFFPNKAEIVDWLQEHYTTDSWHELKR